MHFIVIHVTLCKICKHGGFSQRQSHITCSANVTFPPFLSWLLSADVSSDEQGSDSLLGDLVAKRYHTLHLDTFLVYPVPPRVDHLLVCPPF